MGNCEYVKLKATGAGSSPAFLLERWSSFPLARSPIRLPMPFVCHSTLAPNSLRLHSARLWTVTKGKCCNALLDCEFVQVVPENTYLPQVARPTIAEIAANPFSGGAVVGEPSESTEDQGTLEVHHAPAVRVCDEMASDSSSNAIPCSWWR